MPKRVYAIVVLLCCASIARATTITNTRPEIAQMAGYWEVDSVQISALANAQLILNASPSCTTTGSWEYMDPSGSTASDGDEHINMSLDSSGTGANCNNLHNGDSEIVAEIINAAGSLLSSGYTHAKARGIFRYYHEHAGEIKYEIHPMTERDTWNGSAFVLANDYHNTIRPDAYGTGYALSTYQDMASGGNQQVTVQVLADNNRVVITYPTAAGADTANYGQFDGQVVQTLTSDSTSPYITFHATNSPAGAISGARIMRCRLITNTVAYTVATALGSNQTVTVNLLNRVDMLGMSNVVASLGAGQSMTITQPLEWITLGLTNVGPNVPPTAIFSGSPTNGTAPLTVTFTDGSAGSITNRFWSFGDGGTSNTTATSVQYVYQTAGSYQVALIASGLGGLNTNTKPNYIVVSSGAPPPSASFTASPTVGPAPLTVNFTDNSTGTITSVSWAFGDGGTTTFAAPTNVQYLYATPGVYTVTLIDSGSAGASTNTQSNLITVMDPYAWWASNYFGCASCSQAQGNADPYGKGISNTNQFLLGLNPTNPASVFRILTVVQQTTDVVVTWDAGAGRTNALQATSGDASGNYSNNFVDITTPPHIIIPGSGDVTTNYTDSGGATNSPTRYYRVRLVP